MLLFVYCGEGGNIVGRMVRTNIELDEGLVREALARTRLTTKKAAVNFALEELVAKKRRKDLLKFFGSGCWSGGRSRWLRPE